MNTERYTCLFQTVLEVSMKKIVLGINVRIGDWTAELAIIASNEYE